MINCIPSVHRFVSRRKVSRSESWVRPQLKTQVNTREGSLRGGAAIQGGTGWHRMEWQDRHFCKIQCSIALCGTCRPDDRTDYHLAAKVDLDLMARGSEESDGGSDRDEVLPPRLGRLLRLLHILTRTWRCHSDKNIEDNKTIGNSRADHTYDAWSRQCDDHKPRVSSNGAVQIFEGSLCRGMGRKSRGDD